MSADEICRTASNVPTINVILNKLTVVDNYMYVYVYICVTWVYSRKSIPIVDVNELKRSNTRERLHKRLMHDGVGGS